MAAELTDIERRWAIARDMVDKLEPRVRELTKEQDALKAQIAKESAVLDKIRDAIRKALAV